VRNTAKNSKQKVTNPHVSLVGHITPEELKKRLDESDVMNGFINRFCPFAVRRDSEVPSADELLWGEDLELIRLLKPIRDAIEKAGKAKLQRSKEAEERWCKVFYPRIKRRSLPGLYGKILARALPHVLRFSTIYAIIDGSTTIELKHQLAAEAVVDYCERSAKWAFGAKTGKKTVDRIISELARRPQGLSIIELRESVFSRNYTAAQITDWLIEARESGEVDARAVNGKETWFHRMYLIAK
jgi:hypothetical protein